MALVVMRRRLLKRLPIALLIALFVSLGVGAAVATDAPDEAVAMVVPAARDGDRGVYSLSLEGDWDDESSGFYSSTGDLPEPPKTWDAIAFTWGMRDVETRAGSLVSMPRVEANVTAWGGQAGFPWGLETYQRSIAYAGVEAHAAGIIDELQLSSAPATVSAPEVTLDQDGELVVETLDYVRAHPECFLSPLFAGAELVAGVAGRVPHACQVQALGRSYSPPTVAVPEDTVIQVEGPVDLDGLQAMHVRFLGTPLQAWFAPGLPVPLQYSIQVDDATARFRLTGFEPGTAPLEDVAVPAPGVRALAPTHPWGVDGLDAMPMPASVAYASMQADGTAGPIVEAGDVVSGFYVEGEYNGVMTRAWGFAVVDGDKEYIILVAESIPAAAAPLPRAVLDPAPRNVAVYGPWAVQSDLRVLPPHAPSAADAAAAWRDAGGEGAWNYASFAPCAACEGGIMVAAGNVDAKHLSQQRAPDAPGTLGTVQHMDVLAIDGSDAPAALVRSSWTAPNILEPEEAPAQESTLAAVRSDASFVSPGQAAAIGLFGLMAGALYMFWPVLKAGPVALFSRLRKPELLEHPTRQMIVDAVTAQPGIHLSDLARLTGLANGTMRHHIDHLVRNDVLIKRTNAGYTCLFLKATDRRQLDIAPLLRSEGARTVLEAVRANPGVTGKEVAALTGLANGTVGYHIRRLGDAGAIQATRQGRKVALTAA